MRKVSFVATDSTITIIFQDKVKGMRRVQIKKEQPEFQEIKELLRNKDEEAIIEKLSENAKIILSFSDGTLTINESKGVVIDQETDTEVDLVLSKKIIEWAKDGLPFQPLLKFHRKVIKNPNVESAKDLFAFLENNQIPITESGNFLVYKKVKTIGGKLFDSHTGKIPNEIGSTISMDREEVDADRTKDCSYGYHVGAYEYVSSFSGDTVLLCEVSPEDVVAVPLDYQRQKMRTCKYKIISGYRDDKQIEDKLIKDTDIVDILDMTAQAIKDYIKENYKVEIKLSNKSKQAIIKQALKIIKDA